MGRQYPAEDIQEGGGFVLVPNGTYRCAVTINETVTKQTNKMMLVFSGRIITPEEFAGITLTENFVIGSDQDPQAEDPDTWKKSIGASIFTRCRNAAGVAGSGDLDADLEAINSGKEVMVLNAQELSSTPNPRTGERGKQNKITTFFPVPDGGAAPAPAKPKAAAPAPKAAPAPAKPVPINAPKAKPKAEATLKCQVCAEDIPRSAFADHVETHPENEE